MRKIFFSVLAGLLLSASPLLAANYAEAFKQIAAGNAVLVDVRESAELKDGVIEGANWLATSDIKGETETYRKALAALPKDKTIYTYCAVGGRSGQFTSMLTQKGYKSENLGGFSEVIAAGGKIKNKK